MTAQGVTRVYGNKKGLFTRQRQPKMVSSALMYSMRQHPQLRQPCIGRATPIGSGMSGRPVACDFTLDATVCVAVLKCPGALALPSSLSVQLCIRPEAELHLAQPRFVKCWIGAVRRYLHLPLRLLRLLVSFGFGVCYMAMSRRPTGSRSATRGSRTARGMPGSLEGQKVTRTSNRSRMICCSCRVLYGSSVTNITVALQQEPLRT
eukprot:6195311-Pleurochrysis_carterae.AAC.2